MWEIIKKDLLQFRKDKKSLILSFLLPIVLISLFALVYGGIDGKSKAKPQTILLSDLDKTDLSSQIIAKLNKEPALLLKPTPLEEGKKLVVDGKNTALLCFYKGFADSVNQGKTAPMELFYDEAKSMEIGLMQKALMSTIMNFIGQKGGKAHVKQFINQKYADLPDDILGEINQDIDAEFTDGGGSNSFSSDLKTTPLSIKQGIRWGLIQAVSGTLVMMLLFSMSGIGNSILGENEKGTLKRLLFSPLSPYSFLYGKMFAGMILALAQIVVLLLFSYFVFGLNLFHNPLGLILMVLSTAFACSGFGIFIASLGSSQKQVESLSTIVILIMSAVGGSMIPFFLMPAILLKVAKLSINYWSIQGFFDVFGRNASWTNFLLNPLMLFIFGLVASLLAAFFFKRRLLKTYR
jgi:ABC-type multidrug transport system permease subunit